MYRVSKGTSFLFLKPNNPPIPQPSLDDIAGDKEHANCIIAFDTK